MLNTVSAVQPGHWLLSHTGWDNVLDFDLKTNKGQILLGRGFPGPHLRKFSVPRQKPAFPFYQYYWQHQGFLWAVTQRSFARVSLKDGQVQSFPGFISENSSFTFLPWSGMVRAGPGHLLMQNFTGLWLLEMPGQLQ